jgi:hypothetical protein
MSSAPGERSDSTGGVDRRAEATAVLRLIGAWLFVSLPAIWGIAQVVQKSRALFR